jgi:hypothetical protein
MIANNYLLQHKCIRVIENFTERTGLSLRESLDLFYKSLTYKEMSEGISDMHCRSDEYLAEELRLEISAK